MITFSKLRNFIETLVGLSARVAIASFGSFPKRPVVFLKNNRVFLSRNYRLIVAPRIFDVKKQIFSGEGTFLSVRYICM